LSATGAACADRGDPAPGAHFWQEKVEFTSVASPLYRYIGNNGSPTTWPTSGRASTTSNEHLSRQCLNRRRHQWDADGATATRRGAVPDLTGRLL